MSDFWKFATVTVVTSGTVAIAYKAMNSHYSFSASYKDLKGSLSPSEKNEKQEKDKH